MCWHYTYNCSSTQQQCSLIIFASLYKSQSTIWFLHWSWWQVQSSISISSLVEQFGQCPIPVTSGKPEMGKSNALQAGLSLFGCDEIGMCVKASNSILLERACSSGMYVVTVINAWHDLIDPLACTHSQVLCPGITFCPLYRCRSAICCWREPKPTPRPTTST